MISVQRWPAADSRNIISIGLSYAIYECAPSCSDGIGLRTGSPLPSQHGDRCSNEQEYVINVRDPLCCARMYWNSCPSGRQVAATLLDVIIAQPHFHRAFCPVCWYLRPGFLVSWFPWLLLLIHSGNESRFSLQKLKGKKLHSLSCLPPGFEKFLLHQ